VFSSVITEQKNGHITFDIPKEYIGSDGKIEIGFRISGVYPRNQLNKNAINDKRCLSLRLKDMDIYEISHAANNMHVANEHMVDNVAIYRPMIANYFNTFSLPLTVTKIHRIFRIITLQTALPTQARTIIIPCLALFGKWMSKSARICLTISVLTANGILVTVKLCARF
jgi:hypothetical protein